jgi:hypothetical protein
MTLFVMIGCLVWSAREFLNESMWNFSLVIMMGIILFFIFVISMSFFSSVFNEFRQLFVVLDALVIATLPLVGGALLSWFLCVEISSLDLSVCFSVCYFLLLAVLGRPRSAAKDDNEQASSPLLPVNIMKMLYMLPILISLVVHVALHWNVISTERTRVVNLVNDLCFPAFLMSVCARRHIAHWPEKERADVLRMLGNIKVIAASTWLLCAQFHPALDELKTFSGLKEPNPSFLIFSAIICAAASFYAADVRATTVSIGRQQHHHHDSDNEDDDEEYYDRNARRNEADSQTTAFSLSSYALSRIISNVLAGSAVMCVAVLVNIPRFVVPVCGVGTIALAELHLFKKRMEGFPRFLLLLIAMLSIWVVSLCFTRSTIYYLMFNFAWYKDLTMQQFCRVLAMTLAISVALPVMSRSDAEKQRSRKEASLLPSSLSVNANRPLDRSGQSSFKIEDILDRVFIIAFPIASLVFSGLELMLREQIWDGIGITSEIAYPSSFLILSSCLLCGAAYSLYRSDSIGAFSLLIQLVIAGAKLVHMAGVGSAESLAAAGVILAFGHLIVRLYAEVAAAASRDNSSEENSVRSFTGESMLALLFSSAIIVKAVSTSASTMLALALESSREETSALQIFSCGLGMLCLYLAFWSLVYVRRMKTLRG